VLQVADAEAADTSAKLAAASSNAWAWQQNCAVMQLALDSTTNLTVQSQAIAALALQDAAAAHEDAAAAQTRAILAE